MGRNKRLSRDQKRKHKLAERSRHPLAQTSLAYEGKKYKTDELIPVYAQTELAILEVYVMTERTLTDGMVRTALEDLVGQMRQGPLPPLADEAVPGPVQNNEGEWVIWNIRSRWNDFFQTNPRPNAEKLIGILRTTLHSINVWSSPSTESRGYLHYTEGFLKKQGFNVQRIQAAGRRLEVPAVPELLEIGWEWLRTSDEEAAYDFKDLAKEMTENGQAETVVGVCHQLMGQAKPGRMMEELSAISIHAQKTLRTK